MTDELELPDRTLTPEQHLALLEQTVGLFAAQLSAAQDAGVSHALIIPRLMVAFRRSFGEPPPGVQLPFLPPAVMSE